MKWMADMTDEDKTPQKKHFYEKLSFESYEEYAAMIDRILFQFTGKTPKRTPE